MGTQPDSQHETSVSSMMSFSSQALLVFVGFIIVEEHLSENVASMMGLFIAVLCILSTIFIAPQQYKSQSMMCWLIPSPHLSLVMLLGTWYLFHNPVKPPPTSFTLEPVVHAFGMFAGQLYLAVRGFPWTTRWGALVVLAGMRVIRPEYSIAWREPVLFAAFGLTGLILGTAIIGDATLTRRLVELTESNRVAEANRLADSKLNHVIKGQCGGAAALVSTLVEAHSAEGKRNNESGLELQETLEQVHGMLLQAVQWCHKREAFLQLEDGSYVTAMVRVNLRAELERLLGPRADVTAVGTLAVDETILRLVVQEVGTNAMKYSPNNERIRVEANLLEDKSETAALLSITISNRNRPGVPHLSAAECQRVFEKGFRKSVPHASWGRITSSNGLGLSSARMAVKAIGGDIWMTADQNHTFVHIVLPATRCADYDAPLRMQGCNEAGLDVGDAGLVCSPTSTTCAIDKLELTVKMTAPINTSPVPASSSAGTGHLLPCGGAADDKASRVVLQSVASHDQPSAVRTSVDKPLASATRDKRPPICIGIDDSQMLRKVQATLFHFFLKADTARSGSVGATASEVEAFVDIVMGKRTLSLEPATLSPADIAVLDEHIDIELNDGTHGVRGSELAWQLRARGFTGVVCILSGSSTEVLADLARLSGVDYVFDKGTNVKSIGQELLAAHERSIRRAQIMSLKGA